ncbi:MAG: VWA domain-containing protein [Alphaproteobacteria bacterium]
MGKSDNLPTTTSSHAEIDAFLRDIERLPRGADGRQGRLIFGLDATASRERTWDRACQIQAEMFRETAALGGLAMQLAYYRGFGELTATNWTSDSAALLREMTRVTCLGGRTQIGRLLRHAGREARKRKVDAMIFVGDCIEDDVDDVCHVAGKLGLVGLPVFVFHEIGNAAARPAFQQIAKLTGGAYCPFDESSAARLSELLRAVAVYAAGGRPALEDYGRRAPEAVRLLTSQLGARG